METKIAWGKPESVTVGKSNLVRKDVHVWRSKCGRYTIRGGRGDYRLTIESKTYDGFDTLQGAKDWAEEM